MSTVDPMPGADVKVSPAVPSQPDMTPRRAHEPWIDWLRAIASIAVVVFHLNEVRSGRGTGPYASITSFGWLGVPVFFVVSGYCVMLSSIDRPAALGFLFKRYARVLPPYWASLLVVCTVVVARKVLTGYNDVAVLPHGLGGVIATLTLMTKPVTDIPVINWVYWTLSYELAFYGAMTLGLIKRTLFAPSMLALTAAVLVLPLYPLAKLPGLFFLDQWPLFALGLGLAEVIHRRSLFGRAMMMVAVPALVMTSPVAVVATGLLTAGSIYGVRACPSVEAQLHSRLFVFLGGVSYSLYLIHVPIGIYVLGYFVDLGTTIAQPARLLVDALVVAGCIAAAYVFSLIVERPAQRLAKSIMVRQAMRRAAVSAPTIDKSIAP